MRVSTIAILILLAILEYAIPVQAEVTAENGATAQSTCLHARDDKVTTHAVQ